MTAARVSTTQRVQDLVSPLVARLAAAKRPSADEVSALWRKLVGSKAAHHSHPTSLRGGELMVAVDTSTWLWNLSLQRPRLLEGCQAAWGADTVTMIRLRMKPLTQE